MSVYSYHTFYFPFKWEFTNDDDLFISDKIDIDRIDCKTLSQWQRCYLSAENNSYLDPKNKKGIEDAKELFAERQYFFEFVHPVLYDMGNSKSNLLHHYERREPKEQLVEYHIDCKYGKYTLNVDAINLNIYSTGVGIISLFLSNDREEQKDSNSILNINQYGRRIMPPHAGEFKDSEFGRGMIANSLAITGLHSDDSSRYSDDFDYHINNISPQMGLNDTWKPSSIIKNLINDFNSDMTVIPIIDDRMFVNCVYKNEEIIEQIKTSKDEYINTDFWYQYLFVDDQSGKMCHNIEMQNKLVEERSYMRWSNLGGLTGVTRYSMVAITNADFIMRHYCTIYSRMFELIILQRATILKFSDEVTKVSTLKGASRKIIADRISSLYKEYIRYINQIHFRSITAQEQGIELYNLMLKTFKCEEYSKELDAEINELYHYASLLMEQKRSENGAKLNFIATIFLPATIFTGIFGMNPFDTTCVLDIIVQIAIIVLISLLSYKIANKYKL